MTKPRRIRRALGVLLVPETTTFGPALTASAGARSAKPVSLACQWLRGGAPIVGATASACLLTDADAGAVIAVTVTGTKSGYATVSSTLVATAPIPVPPAAVTKVESTIGDKSRTVKLSEGTAKYTLTVKAAKKYKVSAKYLGVVDGESVDHEVDELLRQEERTPPLPGS